MKYAFYHPIGKENQKGILILMTDSESEFDEDNILKELKAIGGLMLSWKYYGNCIYKGIRCFIIKNVNRNKAKEIEDHFAQKLGRISGGMKTLYPLEEILARDAVETFYQ